MNQKTPISLPSYFILLPVIVFLVSTCQKHEVGSQLGPTPTTPPTSATPTVRSPEATRTLSLDRPDTVRATLKAKATEDASLLPTERPVPTSTIQPTETPLGTFIPTFTSIPLDGLTLEGYALAPENEFIYSRTDQDAVWEFYARIPDSIFESRAGWWAPIPEPQPSIEDINRILSPFGYYVKESIGPDGLPAYALFKGEELINDWIKYFRKILINRSGTDFALVYNHSSERDLAYARNGYEDPYWNTQGGYDWMDGVDLAFYIGDKLLRVNVEHSPVVIQDDEIIYTHPYAYSGPSHCPLTSFQKWVDQWVMEVDGEVILNGEPLHEKHGFDQTFHWTYLNGQPLFFFEKDDKFSISYNNKILSVEFDEIAYTLCGDSLLPPTLGPWDNHHILGFFARMAGFWYYFELGAF